MDRLFYLIGALAAFVGVAAGAFGAHGLKERLSADMLAVFETGARHQMYPRLRLALRRGHRHLLRQPLRPEPDGAALARRRHAPRRTRLPRRLALPRRRL